MPTSVIIFLVIGAIVAFAALGYRAYKRSEASQSKGIGGSRVIERNINRNK